MNGRQCANFSILYFRRIESINTGQKRKKKNVILIALGTWHKKKKLAFLKVARTLKLKLRNNPGRTICSQVEETFKVIRRAVVPF